MGISNNNSEYWVGLADYDFDTAKAMQATGRFLYVGFMCHQTIEKALKAYVIAKSGGIPPKIHDLLRLARQSDIYSLLSDDQKDVLDILAPLNIEARYPSDKERIMQELNQERCQEILFQTEDLLQWIKKRL